MKTITKIAIKTKDGIKTAPIGKHHKDIGVKGQRGFIDSKGKFENRVEADKTALKSHQTKTHKPLHSHQVKRSGK